MTRIMLCIHYYSIMQNIFTTLKFFCASLIHSFPSVLLWISSYHCVFVCFLPLIFFVVSRILPFAECDINGIIYSLLCWASSIQYSASGSFPGGKLVKNPPANVRDLGSIPGLGRSPGGGHSNPFQYSCLENPMDRGAWRAKIQSVTKSWIWLKQLGKPACILRLRFL